MKLCRQLIPGNPFILEEISGIFEYGYYESTPDNWEDANTIQDHENFGIRTRKDYKYRRGVLKETMINIVGADFSNWDLLTLDEKKICITYLISAIPPQLSFQVFTLSELRQIGLNFHKNSKDCRTERFNIAVGELYSWLQPADANKVIDDLNRCYTSNGVDYTYNLFNLYTYFGREGTLEGDPEGMFDYIEARTGTSFETWGLLIKGYIPNYGTLQQCVDSVMQILKYGNY